MDDELDEREFSTNHELLKAKLAKRSQERNDLLKRLDEVKRSNKRFSDSISWNSASLSSERSLALKVKRMELECRLKDIIINSFEDALCESEAKVLTLEKKVHLLTHEIRRINDEDINENSKYIADENVDSEDFISSGIDRFLKLSAEMKHLSDEVVEKDRLLQDQIEHCVCKNRSRTIDSSSQTETSTGKAPDECKADTLLKDIGSLALADNGKERRLTNSFVKKEVVEDDRRVDFIISVDCLRGSLAFLRKQHAELWGTATALPIQMKIVMLGLRKDILDAVSGSFQRLASRSRQEYLLRKQIHNELLDLRGNIRVFCRIRPHIAFCEGPEMSVCTDTSDDQLVQIFNKGDRGQLFTFDHVFGPGSSQEEVFDGIRAMIVSCMDGYNVCVFAYGQTGSGKTYTMEGPKANPGIYERAVATIFEEAANRGPYWQYQVFVSVLEIYNEGIYDLLGAPCEEEKLQLKLNADGSVKIAGITSIQVDSLEELSEVFAYGHGNRFTAATAMNDRSSRSHCIVRINVKGKNDVTSEITNSVLNLIDLAGSERVNKSGSTGDRLKEAQSINRSLSALGDVLHALRNKQSHIPFRNSKLTFLLQDCLKGQSKTLMVVQAAPSQEHLTETLSTLTFAQRVRSIELGQVHANRFLSPNRAASPATTNRCSSPNRTASPASRTNSPMGTPSRRGENFSLSSSRVTSLNRSPKRDLPKSFKP